MSRDDRRLALSLAVGLLVCLAACGRETSDSPTTTTVRLVDTFRAEMVKGTPDSVGEIKPLASWDFSKPSQLKTKEAPETLGWKPGRTVSGLNLRNGRLAARSTSDFPIIYVTQTIENDDLVHSIEIRMRSNKGTNLSVSRERKEEVDFNEIRAMAGQMPWPDTTPLMSGEGFQTYTIEFMRPMSARNVRHLLIRPSDASGADFEIESVRLVSRREHLARIPSGIGWQGLADVYRETLVARSPETIALDVDVAENAWLDLNVGTVEFAPVTFKLNASRSDDDSERIPLLERTVTTPHRWESVPVDLSPYQGSKLRLELSLESTHPGALGFWGGPVVRTNRDRIDVAQQKPAEPRAGQGNQAPRGVILIMADTLRRDHLNFYGYNRETAPYLARMAKEGVLFNDALTQATWTKVSTPSIMTSLYPSAHGVKEFTDQLPAAANTMAEVFRQAGYATVSYSSVLFTGKFTNLHQGFEELHESTSVADPESSKTAREYVDRLTRWLEQHRDVPFFAFLHVFDPHDPYEPYQPYNSLWADIGKKEEHLEHLEKVRKVIQDPLMRNFGMPSRDDLIKAGLDPDEYVGHDRDWYDGSIRALDSEISRLMQRLRSLGLADNTLIVFTSDHGEEFLDHGRMFHGQSVYGELNQVPLIFRMPGGVPSSVVVNETVESIDVMPTILELCRLPAPGKMQGRSLVPLMTGQKSGTSSSAGGPLVTKADGGWVPQPAITEKAPTKHVGGPPPRDTGAVAISWNGWKLIHNFENLAGKPEYELYNRAKDPLDKHNLAASHPEQVKQMRAMIDKWRKTVVEARLPAGDAGQNLSKEELNRLRSLGYVK